MKIADRFHLTYCTNIHPGETWQAVDATLRDALPRIRGLLRFSGPFAVGLRVSAGAASALEDPRALESFKAFLAAGDYYVPTINGFPYGAFHGGRVKERVYLPDWRDPARLNYSNRLARILAALLADRRDIEGSVSTVPGAFRSEIRSEADEVTIASNILRHAAYLVALRERTGVTITLGLEPEPACFIETTDEATAFFARYLFDDALIDRVARETGTLMALDEVRRHIGVCCDACHMAVEFEDPAGAFRRLAETGVRVCKVQVSAALQIDGATPAALARALGPFAEDTYLHQVVEWGEDRLERYTDLPDALRAAERAGPAQPRDWRVHYHVPIFLASMNGFGTTQPYLASLLDTVRASDICSCLEVETYTWDVLPPEYRTTDVCTAIARELTWARTTLER